MRAPLLPLALLASLTAAGCSCDGPRTATQVVVVVDADDEVRARATSLRLEVFGDPAMPAPAFPVTMRDDSTFTTSSWPRIFALAPENRDASRVYRVVATASEGTTPVAVARVISGYVPGEVRTVRLYLSAACDVDDCDDDETCAADTALCEDARVDPEDLDPYSPDAGPSMDAGPPGDAPSNPCTPADCDDEIGCTEDTCTPSGCVHVPVDSACDDAEVCTEDRCDAALDCIFEPQPTTACEDGDFCNGLDSCDGEGTCGVHTGDPCASAGRACDADAMGCEGACSVDGDCPDDTTGAWSGCDYTGSCDETATQTRTLRTWACEASVCVPTDTSESMACTRATEGMACGTTSCSGFGLCDYADDCDVAAVRSQSCVDLLCASGACQSATRTETMPCSRTTSGMSCTSSGCPGTCNASGVCNATCPMDGGFDAGFDGGRDAPEVGPDAHDTGADTPDAFISIALDSSIDRSETGVDEPFDGL